MSTITRVRAGSLDDLRTQGRLTTKVDALPAAVVGHNEMANAIEDRCPHRGSPVPRCTVEGGMLTCHWHHARFDLLTGCWLDPWADDAIGFDVDLAGGDVWVSARPPAGRVDHLEQRLRDGLEQ